MMLAEKLLNIYLDANIILGVAALVWMIARSILRMTPLRHAYLPQLQMIYGALITFALMPLVLLGLGFARHAGLIGLVPAPNLSDFVVAQYLSGNIAMAPTRFESLLMLRSDLIVDVATLASPLGKLVALALITGTLFFVVRLCRNVWRVTRLIRNSYVLRRVGHIDIRLTDHASVPFSTRGLMRHYIILPTSLLMQSNDVRVAVSHEIQHMRQGDLIWEVLLEMLRPVFFWNPAFGFWKHEVETQRELACDQQVLRRQTFDVKDYCDCLLRVCRTSLRQTVFTQLHAPTVPFVKLDGSRRGSQSGAFLKRRVVSMLHPARTPNAMLTAMMALPLVAAIAFGSLVSQQANDWSHDRLMLSTIVNLERLDIRNGVSN